MGWLVARWFLGGEMVGGEIPWWRDDRIPARFNKRIEGAQESVIDFIESLFTVAETSQFGTLKEELIRDCIVVGIRNAVLSQQLM